MTPIRVTMHSIPHNSFGAIAGPSKYPYEPPRESNVHAKQGPCTRQKRRSCACSPASISISLLVGTLASLPLAAASGEREVRSSGPLARGGVEWDIEASLGRRAPQTVSAAVAESPDNLADQLLAESSAILAASAAPTVSSATPYGSATSVHSVPTTWLSDPRTSFYAVPVIIVCSIVLALGIALAILTTVYYVRRRKNRRVRAQREDPEHSVDGNGSEKAKMPRSRKAKLITAVKRSTPGLRRRGRKWRQQQALHKPGRELDTESIDPEETEPSAVLHTASVVEGNDGPERASIVSISTGGDRDTDADSFTALTSSGYGGDDRRSTVSRAPRSSHGPTHFFLLPLAARRSAVSVASLDILPSAPPAYGRPLSPRREGKQRVIDEMVEGEDDPPPLSASDMSPSSEIDRSQFVGHVAIDEKAALSRLADMASGPEGSEAVAADMSAPDIEALEHAALELALEIEDTPILRPSAPSSTEGSLSMLPAPPTAVQLSFRGLVEPVPSAPSTSADTAVTASAPPLPDYEESVMGTADVEETRLHNDARMGHAVV